LWVEFLRRGLTNETEAENEAAILLAESLEHRQRTPEEDALLELLTILIEKFEEDRYPVPTVSSDGMLVHLMEARNMKQEELVGVIGSRGVQRFICFWSISIFKSTASSVSLL
jgi:HTH-type transcriptional regulator / antitoxin HigA